MRFHVCTLFPEMIQAVAETSILGRAVKNGAIAVETVNIRDFSQNKHHRVDDYPYGGGAGMVMEAEPVYEAVLSVQEKLSAPARVVYLTPQARVLTQTQAEQLAMEEELILLCGHYEGIDERVLEEVVTDYVSIGDYVLTGGELAAMVLIDAVSRFVPGVLGSEESSRFESLQDQLLEYPHYTRPETWHGRTVPQVLLSGNHTDVDLWRREASVRRTEERRPDLMRRSLEVCVIAWGSEAWMDTARSCMELLTQYGTLLDYNRRKLQKQKRRMNQKTLLLFLPPEEGEDPDLAERFRMLLSEGSPAVCASFPDGTASFLTEKGFHAMAVPAEGSLTDPVTRKKWILAIRTLLDEMFQKSLAF